jgi:hypothetical protein
MSDEGPLSPEEAEELRCAQVREYHRWVDERDARIADLTADLRQSREQTAAVERERDYLRDRLVVREEHLRATRSIATTAEREVSKLREALRPEVAAFARLMEAKLRENDHKGGWDQESKHWLLGRLKEETSELDDALNDWCCAKTGSQGEREATVVVGAEAADVANFAMMIADRCGSLRTALSFPTTPAGEVCPEVDYRSVGCALPAGHDGDHHNEMHSWRLLPQDSPYRGTGEGGADRPVPNVRGALLARQEGRESDVPAGQVSPRGPHARVRQLLQRWEGEAWRDARPHHPDGEAVSGKERERRLRDALKHMVSAYGRPDKHEGAVRFAQRVLKETEGPPDGVGSVDAYHVGFRRGIAQGVREAIAHAKDALRASVYGNGVFGTADLDNIEKSLLPTPPPQAAEPLSDAIRAMPGELAKEFRAIDDEARAARAAPPVAEPPARSSGLSACTCKDGHEYWPCPEHPTPPAAPAGDREGIRLLAELHSMAAANSYKVQLMMEVGDFLSKHFPDGWGSEAGRP